MVANRQRHWLLEWFLGSKLYKVYGQGDSEMAPRWVEELEKAFEILGCTETNKVTVARY